jgi:hypothetical protein
VNWVGCPSAVFPFVTGLMYFGGTYLAVVADRCSPFLSAGQYNYSSRRLNSAVISILPKGTLGVGTKIHWWRPWVACGCRSKQSLGSRRARSGELTIYLASIGRCNRDGAPWA